MNRETTLLSILWLQNGSRDLSNNMQILVATNNQGKLNRVRQLLTDTGTTCLSPSDLGIPVTETKEGSDLRENSERKARAYEKKTDLPILGMDTAFFISGEALDPAKVRRNALHGRDESTMMPDEIGLAMVNFYREIVEKRGENIPSYWEDAFALVLPDGSVRHESGRRLVTLTSQVHGKINPALPLRSLYIVEATGKYANEQSPEEELLELKPYKEALLRILRPISISNDF
jgi:hypothetical protein